MRHVIVIEHVFGLRLVNLETGNDVVHVQNEIVGVIFTAGPLVEAEIALFLNGFGRRAIEDGFSLLRRSFAGVYASEILFHFRMKPPGPDDGGTNGHFNSS